MALIIENERTLALIRELAERTGQSQTGAVESAVKAQPDALDALDAEFPAAVKVGLDQIERGESVRIPSGELSGCLDELSREATERVARKSA